MKRKIVMILVIVFFMASLGVCLSDQDVENLLQKEYRKLDLLGFEKGQFTGSRHEEYLAFYQIQRYPGEEYSYNLIGKLVVFIIEME
jgi:hypothetical protein